MSLLFDLASTLSIVGIWPRFIEPRCVRITHLNWRLPPEAAHLSGLCFVQLSDLHFNAQIPQKFLDRIVRRTLREKPDIIFFTGDFLCHSNLQEGPRLMRFLNRLQAPLGSYCIFGNHDYERYVSCNAVGLFTTAEKPSPWQGISRGLRTLVQPSLKQHYISPAVERISLHQGLMDLLRNTPFTLMENTTITLPIGINVTGLGELSLGRTRPDTAFSGYNHSFPGIVLTHNPDTFPDLIRYPGDWILAGHTHGEQIHLPWCRSLSRKLTRLVHQEYTRGYYRCDHKHLYVSRGLGSPKPFRFLSPPEIVVIRASI